MTDQNMLNTKHDEMLFAYIDNELDQSDRARLDELLKNDATLRARLHTLESINTRLEQATSVPQQPMNTTDPAPLQTKTRRWIGYAALIAIVGVSILMLSKQFARETFDAGAYYNAISKKLEPQHICDTPEKFSRYTEVAFGDPIHADFSTSLELVGWRYIGAGVYDPDIPSRKPVTRVLMARTNDGTSTLAFFVPKELPVPALENGSGLNIYKHSVLNITIYEVSPMSEAQILPVLSTHD